MKRSVLLIYTGGTIGMVEDAATRTLQPFLFEELTKQVSELQRFDLSMESVSFDPPVDSSNMGIREWQQIAQTIEEHYHQYDGFVVLHGTDTMAYSASALSFMLQGLRKPVIFTGSQLPIGVLRTDGKENLITAIQLAAMEAGGNSVIQEVAIYFGSSLYRGNRTHKHSTEDFDAIQSPNLSPLAEAGIHIHFRHDLLFRAPEGMEFRANTTLDDRVAVMKLFPGLSDQYVEAICNLPDLQCLVMETFGSGNAPTRPEFLRILKEARDRGIQIMNVTQCNEGFVEQGRYATSHQLRDLGVIPAADMTLEATVAKAMYVLPRVQSDDSFEQQMLKSLRGELTTFSALV